MKPLEKEELYKNLNGFLKTKGIELKQGSYSRGIQNACELLAEAINLGQKGLSRAKVEVDQKLDQVRHVIHEKTAPKPGSKTPPPKPPPLAREKSASPKNSTKSTGNQKKATQATGKRPGKN